MPRREFAYYRLSSSPEALKQAVGRFAYVREINDRYYAVYVNPEDVLLPHDFGINTRPVYSSDATDVRRIRSLQIGA